MFTVSSVENDEAPMAMAKCMPEGSPLACGIDAGAPAPPGRLAAPWHRTAAVSRVTVAVGLNF
jgi:hypothetical protein